MAKRRWTIVLVPHGAEPSRVIEISHRLLKGAIATLITLTGCALLVGYATVSHRVDLSRAAWLEEENARLAQELGDIHGRLSHLADTLAQISQRDAKIRVLANLEPIDPQVRAAGIGGPLSPVVASASPLERRSSGVRIDVNALIRRANLLASSFRVAADSLASHTDRLAATPSIMPTKGWLSSAFQSMREHPILHVARPHEGIDVSAPAGSPIEAPASGRVISAGWEQGYGNTLELDHGYGITTRYAHASRLLVKVGQQVQRGQRIALVGNSGLATGPHLHYEVHVNGKPVNPLHYVMPESVVAD